MPLIWAAKAGRSLYENSLLPEGSSRIAKVHRETLSGGIRSHDWEVVGCLRMKVIRGTFWKDLSCPHSLSSYSSLCFLLFSVTLLTWYPPHRHRNMELPVSGLKSQKSWAFTCLYLNTPPKLINKLPCIYYILICIKERHLGLTTKHNSGNTKQ